MIEYRSIADINTTILRNLSRIPHDLDLIVGIPRSGLLAGSILALHLNLPLTDIDGFLAGRLLGCGPRLSRDRSILDASRKLRVFVVDDSINTGKQMQEVRKKLASQSTYHEILYAAVFGTHDTVHQVDFCFEAISPLRIFEWNIMHSWILDMSCVDIDGVLCRDPTQLENDDGPRYLHFLKTAEPLILPTVSIGWIVSCRLEKYRNLTEEWLVNHGITYRELLMMNFPSKADRIASGTHGKFKAQLFAKTGAKLFIESSAEQAREIALYSGKQVYCFETAQMEYPTIIPRSTGAIRTRWGQLLRNLRKFPKLPHKVFSKILDFKSKV